MLRRTKTLASGKVWVAYYYNGRDESGQRKEIPLGTDLIEAKRKWAELECKPPPADTGLMSHIFDRYEREILPTKAPRTQKDNLAELANLRKVFDTAPATAVTPQHIAQYRDRRAAPTKDNPKGATVRANRELALLSHIFNMAREWGYMAGENPCRGVRKNKEKPRDYYANPDVWNAVYDAACTELQDAMDLAYLTGQRPADVLNMRWSDVRDGHLEVQQGKTAKRLRIIIEGALAALLERIKARQMRGLWIVTTSRGQPLNRWTLRARFDAARAQASQARPDLPGIEQFQFRDIRPKAASETSLGHAQALLGHSREQITRTVYQRVGATVKPMK